MTDTSGQLPIAGWYPDPEDAAQSRWWNGVSWSDSRRPLATPVAPPAPVAPVAQVAQVAPVAPESAPANPYLNPYAGAPAAYPAAAPYAAAPYAGDPYAAPPAIPAASNVPALVGFILSIVGLIFGLAAIAGLILSILGLQRSSRMIAEGVASGHRRGLAIAGIVIGGVTTALAGFGLLNMAAGTFSTYS